MQDPINRPQHYRSHPSGIECITVVEHMPFNIGNAIKYCWRSGLKTPDPTEDLLKARWYIDREIQRLQSAQQAATPADNSPLAQDTAEPVRAGSAVDEVPVRGVGIVVSAGQSTECVAVSGAEEAVTDADDPAPAPDAQTPEPIRVETAPAYGKYTGPEVINGSYEAAQPVSRVSPPRPFTPSPRRIPQTNKDRVLDFYAATGGTASQIADALKIPRGSPGAFLSMARKDGDPRVAIGDKKRAVRAQMLPADLGDRLVAVNLTSGDITGPGGVWNSGDCVARAVHLLSDGNTHSHAQIASAADLGESTVEAGLPLWKRGLETIGVQLVRDAGGCRLHRMGV